MTTSILWLSLLTTIFPASFAFVAMLFWKRPSVGKISLLLVILYTLIIAINILMLLSFANFNINIVLNFTNFTNNLGYFLLLLLLLPAAEILIIFYHQRNSKQGIKFYRITNSKLLLLVLLIGTLEEIIYRCIQFNFFVVMINDYYGSVISFIIVSSLLFAGNHYLFTSNVSQIVSKFCLSLLLSTQMILTNNLIICIGGHLLYNLSYFFSHYQVRRILSKW